MQVIEKPTILITSLGRTGTDFFAKFFANVLPNCTSLHEPDIIQNAGVDDRLAHFIGQVRRAGVWRMFFLKAFGKWTLIKLSDSRFQGNLSAQQAKKNLHVQRSSFIKRTAGLIYVEANIGYYGLLDITPQVFKNHRAIYLIRDGRDWVRSHMNWGEMYGKSKVRGLLSHTWPAASEIKDDPYKDEWQTMSRFEKLCWAWTMLNKYALTTVKSNSNAKMFRFEDIFKSDTRYQHLEKLVGFATDIPGVQPISTENLEGWLDRRVHESSGNFPIWPEWSSQQNRRFSKICGPLMKELGYEFN